VPALSGVLNPGSSAVEWTDQAIILSGRPYGESAALLSLLTAQQGRHAGLLPGGQSQRHRALLEPGNVVKASWRARLADQLGTLTLEAVQSTAARFLDDPLRLAALQSTCALLDSTLPDRAPQPRLFAATQALFTALDGPVWAEIYVRWEIGLLEELGFGLDLSRCAATGSNDQLGYVSPRTGRAVSLSAGEALKDRLLPLPPFLIGQSAGGEAEVSAGLQLTGHFLQRHVFAQRHVDSPPARERFVERFRRSVPAAG
jgi:DNA repair protein RecO (recombination protein O)